MLLLSLITIANIMLHQIIPYFGYLASLCLIIALLVNNDLRFRWYNTFGNISFIVYAIALQAFPVLITNVILLAINVFYLIKVYRKKENFELIEFKGEEKLAQNFLQFYQKDIAAYFPQFTPAAMQNNLNFVVLRDLVIANMFSASISPDGRAEVLLNYTLLKYRDYKVGTFIFEKERDYLIAHGIKSIAYKEVYHRKHQAFLTVMGFKKEVINNNTFLIKHLT